MEVIVLNCSASKVGASEFKDDCPNLGRRRALEVPEVQIAIRRKKEILESRGKFLNHVLHL